MGWGPKSRYSPSSVRRRMEKRNSSFRGAGASGSWGPKKVAPLRGQGPLLPGQKHQPGTYVGGKHVHAPILSSGGQPSYSSRSSSSSGGGGGSFGGSPVDSGSSGFESSGGNDFYDVGYSSGPGRSKADLEKQARELLSLEFGPKRSALQRAIEAARKQFAVDESAQKGYGDTHDKRLQEIYNALTGELQAGQGARSQSYDAGIQQTGNILEEAKGSVQGATGKVQADLAAMAQKLGLEAGLRDPTADLQTDSAALMNLLSAEKGTRQAGLSSEKTNQMNFGQGEIDLSRKELGSKRAGLSREVLMALQELGLNKSQAENEYQGELTDLQASEGPALQKILNELQQAEAQNEQDAFARYIQEQTLGIQKGRLGLEAQGQQFGQGIDQAKLGLDYGKFGLEQSKHSLDQQKSQMEFQAASEQDPLKRAKLEAEIRNIDSQIQERNNPASKSGTSKYGKAQVGLNAFVDDRVKSRAIKNPARFRTAMANFIAEVDRTVARDTNKGTGTKIDPYTEAVKLINRSHKKLKISSNLLKQAAAIYYGKA